MPQLYCAKKNVQVFSFQVEMVGRQKQVHTYMYM